MKSSILTRAIEPEAVKAPRPPGDTATPMTAIAAIARTAASTRQNVSLRRILRRSTIRSESSDIEIPLKYVPRVLHWQRNQRLNLHTSIAAQYEENKARTARMAVPGPLHRADNAKGPGRNRGLMTKHGEQRLTCRRRDS